MNGKEIVITGLGVVSPIANELNLFWEGKEDYAIQERDFLFLSFHFIR